MNLVCRKDCRRLQEFNSKIPMEQTPRNKPVQLSWKNWSKSCLKRIKFLREVKLFNFINSNDSHTVHYSVYENFRKSSVPAKFGIPRISAKLGIPSTEISLNINWKYEEKSMNIRDDISVKVMMSKVLLMILKSSVVWNKDKESRVFRIIQKCTKIRDFITQLV